jgi:polar amino acid transport system substrate-binding protein
MRTLAILASLLAATAGACGSASDQARSKAESALAVTAPAPPTTTGSSGQPPTCTNLTASLRPPAHMPASGEMPEGSYMAAILRRGRLIAGVDQNTLQFAAWNPLDQQIEGFEIDLIRELARAIFGNPGAVELRAVTTDQRLTVVQNGAVDLVADAVSITCTRKQQVDFSTVYYDAGQKVLVPSNSTARSIADLAGRRVCATTGSTTYTHLAPYNVIRVGVPQRTDCLVKLQLGQVDAISADDAILLGFARQDPYTNIVGPRFSDEPYGIAIANSHPEFVRFVNGVLDQMRRDGTWARIYAKWLCKDGRPGAGCPPPPPPPSYVGSP